MMRSGATVTGRRREAGPTDVWSDVREPNKAYTEAEYDKFRASFRRIGRTLFPYEMAVKMILKPLDLSPPVGRFVQPAVETTARFLFYI